MDGLVYGWVGRWLDGGREKEGGREGGSNTFVEGGTEC